MFGGRQKLMGSQIPGCFGVQRVLEGKEEASPGVIRGGGTHSLCLGYRVLTLSTFMAEDRLWKQFLWALSVP